MLSCTTLLFGNFQAYLDYSAARTQIFCIPAAPTQLLAATASRRPSISNGGAPVLAALPQPPIIPYCPVPIGSIWTINPAKPSPPSHFWTDKSIDVSQSHIFHQIACPSNPLSNRHAKRCEPVLSFLNILPAPPRHFQTNIPSAVIQSCLFHQITCPSKTFLNWHAKRCDPVPSFSSDFLPLQAIFKLTGQALWSSPVIPHHIHHSSMTPLT